MTYPKQIRIVNTNGNGADTKILDGDTGADLTVGLRCTQIVIDADDFLTAKLTVMPVIDVLVTAQYVATVEYDPTDADTIETAIGQLQARLTELRSQ